MSDDNEDIEIIRVLAWASREFDRVRDRLIADDEPGPAEIAEAVPDEEDGDTERGILATAATAVLGVAKAAVNLATGSVHPKDDDWLKADLDTRIDWWVQRFGTAVAALAALPSFGGAVVRASGIGDALGAAGQVLVVNAVAQEMGKTDTAEQVVAAARIVMDKHLNVAKVRQILGDDLDGDGLPDGDIDTEKDVPEGERPSLIERLGSTAKLIRRVARQIRGLGNDLDKRPQGGWFVKSVANLPAVGLAGGFLAERSGVSTAAKEAREAFA